MTGNFFDWYSKKAPEPVIGWLGGNVLKGFRVMIDFPGHTTYWEQESDLDSHDLDQVGVTLEKRSGGYFIAGIAEKSGKPVLDSVQIGDKLIQIDDVQVSGATRGAIFAALHGQPGSVRLLIAGKGRSPAKREGESNCFLIVAGKRLEQLLKKSSNQSMKPTALTSMNASNLSTAPCRGLSLSR